MVISAIKLIEASYSISKSEFIILAEIISGKPKQSDGIFMMNSILTIKTVSASRLNPHVKITVTSHIEFLGDVASQLRDLEGTIINCGYCIQDYKNLPSKGKVAFLKALAMAIYPPDAADFICRHIQLCISMSPFKNDLSDKRSKFGGLPMAPAQFEYPKDNEGRSPLFIGQIHIGEFNQWFEAGKQLAGDGILYFFGTIDQTHERFFSFGEIMVRYSARVDDLLEIPLPDDLDGYGVFEETDIVILEEVSFPDEDCLITRNAKLNDDESLCYSEFIALLEDYNYTQLPSDFYYYESLKFMGYPQQLQSCVLLTAAQKTFKEGLYSSDKDSRQYDPTIPERTMAYALQLRHLISLSPMPFQILDRFSGTFNEYRGGVYNVLITQDDLKKMNFDDTVCVYQST